MNQLNHYPQPQVIQPWPHSGRCPWETPEGHPGVLTHCLLPSKETWPCWASSLALLLIGCSKDLTARCSCLWVRACSWSCLDLLSVAGSHLQALNQASKIYGDLCKTRNSLLDVVLVWRNQLAHWKDMPLEKVMPVSKYKGFFLLFQKIMDFF